MKAIEMKSIYRSIFCVVLMLGAGLAAVGLLSRDTSAAEPQASAKSAPAQKATTAKDAQSAPAPKAAAGGAQGLKRYRAANISSTTSACAPNATPRATAEGNLDNRHYLQGAPIWIMPVQRMTNWAMRAPAIAGLEGFTDVQAQTVLEKGIGPNGIEIHPPMHIYHMNHADAQAIIAYLRSLPSNYTNP